MISNEQKFIINALRDHLEGHSSVVPEGLDIARLAEIAKQQEVEGILYAQTHLTVFDKAFASACYQSVQRKQLLNKIDEAFTAQNIPYLIFKGPEVAKYYPKPELRSMGDVDILVHKEDFEIAQVILDTFDGTGGGTEPELQYALLYATDKNLANHLAFTDRAWEYAFPSNEKTIQYALKSEFHFIFLLLHLRKHIMWTGVGLRQFMDVAVMIQHCPMDWEEISNTIEELNLKHFAEVCFDLILRWFGIRAPIDFEKAEDSFVQKSTEVILSGGVFGFSNQDENSYQNNYSLNMLHKSNNQALTKWKLTLRTIFPGFDEMAKKYPSMPHTRLLLPLMWLRRFIDALLHKRASNGLQTAVRPLTISNKEIAEREALLKQWGC